MIFGSLFDTLLIERINSSLVQTMDFRLLGVKPFPEPVLTYYPLGPQEQTSVNFQSLFSMSCPLCGTVNVKTTHVKNQAFAFLFQKYLFIEKNNHITEIEWETSTSLGLAPIMKCTSAVDANGSYTPIAYTGPIWKWDILISSCLSLDRMVSAVYLYQYLPALFYDNTYDIINKFQKACRIQRFFLVFNFKIRFLPIF